MRILRIFFMALAMILLTQSYVFSIEAPIGGITSVNVGSQTGSLTAGVAGSVSYTVSVSYSNAYTYSCYSLTYSQTSYTPSTPTGVTPSWSGTPTGSFSGTNPWYGYCIPASGDLTGVTLTLNTSSSTAAGTYTFKVNVAGYLAGTANSNSADVTLIVSAACANPTSGGVIASDQTICSGATPTIFTSVSLPTGHTGTLEYQWQRSTDSIDFVNLATGTYSATTYQSEALTATTWFRRLARVSCMNDWTGADTSNIVKITINPNTTFGNPLVTQTLEIGTTGNSSQPRGWKFIVNENTTLSKVGAIANFTDYCQLFEGTGSSLTALLATSTTLLSTQENFNKVFDMGNISLQTGKEYFIFFYYSGGSRSYKRSGSGSSMALSPVSPIQLVTGLTINSLVFPVTISSVIALNQLQPDVLFVTELESNIAAQTQCINGTFNQISVNPNGSNLSYQWYRNTTPTTIGGNPVGSDTNIYTPLATTAGVLYYYCIVNGDCGPDTSAISGAFTVYPNFNSGAINTTGQTICYNGNPASIGSTTAASGGNDTITYEWYKSTNNFTDSTLIGSITSTYDPPTGLTVTTSYRRYAHDGSCNLDFELAAGTYTVTVYDNFTTGTIASTGETICYNGNPANIGSPTAASGGNDTITYEWYKSINSFTDSTLIGSNTSTYNPPTGLTQTTSYRRYAHDGSCNLDFELSAGTYTITVRSDFASGEISSTGETICYNEIPASIGSTTAASGGNNVITYEWYKSINSFTDSTLIGSNTSAYDPPTGHPALKRWAIICRPVGAPNSNSARTRGSGPGPPRRTGVRRSGVAAGAAGAAPGTGAALRFCRRGVTGCLLISDRRSPGWPLPPPPSAGTGTESPGLWRRVRLAGF